MKMNDQHVKSSVNEVKGKIKEEIGHATGNNKVEAEGVFEQVKGKVEHALGDAKDKVKQKVDQILHKTP
jgi:uncharacterized protein YjbJ (UPF0337 family)